MICHVKTWKPILSSKEISTTKDCKSFKFERSMITNSELYANMSHECVPKESHKSNPRFETVKFITSCRPRHAQLKKKASRNLSRQKFLT